MGTSKEEEGGEHLVDEASVEETRENERIVLGVESRITGVEIVHRKTPSVHGVLVLVILSRRAIAK